MKQILTTYTDDTRHFIPDGCQDNQGTEGVSTDPVMRSAKQGSLPVTHELRLGYDAVGARTRDRRHSKWTLYLYHWPSGAVTQRG